MVEEIRTPRHTKLRLFFARMLKKSGSDLLASLLHSLRPWTVTGASWRAEAGEIQGLFEHPVLLSKPNAIKG
jgi:hypothetical protein